MAGWSLGTPGAGAPRVGVPDLGLRRQFLHAARLAFPHPVTEARVEALSPLPDELSEALEQAKTPG